MFTASVTSAQEVLDNDAIVRLSRAGLGADVIILKIERTNANFDTSAAALIDLKTANVAESVIKAMLIKEPGPRIQASVQSTPAVVRPTASAPSDELCVKLDYYTSGNNGWEWVPSSVCASKTQLTVDEQIFALDAIVVHCIEPERRLSFAGATGRTEPGWRFSDRAQTYEFRGKNDEGKRFYDFLVESHPTLRHGQCNDRGISSLLKPPLKH